MKKIIVFAILILINAKDLSAQVNNDKFLGFWSLQVNSENPLFIITKSQNQYKISLYGNFDVEAAEGWNATLVNNSLIGNNGSTMHFLSDAKLKLDNYEMESLSNHVLYKINLDKYLGVWKAVNSDKEYIKIYLQPSAFAKCSVGSKAYKLFLAKFRPNDSPYNTQDACGTSALIKNESVSIRYISPNKVLVNWKEEKIANTVYTKVGPSFILNPSHQGNLISFWSDFKSAVLKKDYAKLTQLTYFPFLKQGTYINDKEFNQLKFLDNFINPIRTSKSPVKSSMVFNGGTDSNGNPVNVSFDSKTLVEVSLGGPTLYFANVSGSYKFIGIIYGE